MDLLLKAEKRFWLKVKRCEHGWRCEVCCWPWLATCVGHMGYGQFTPYSRDRIYAHVMSWCLYNEFDPRDFQEDDRILHTCDNPPCANFNHLFKGTHKINMQDKVDKGRQFVMHGTEHPLAKLTEAKVRWARRQYAAGIYDTYQLADILGVHQAVAWRAVNRKSWKHVD